MMTAIFLVKLLFVIFALFYVAITVIRVVSDPAADTAGIEAALAVVILYLMVRVITGGGV